jgi:hypothetical protein
MDNGDDFSEQTILLRTDKRDPALFSILTPLIHALSFMMATKLVVK